MLTFVVSLPLLTDFQMGSAAMQFVEQRAWIPAYDIQYHLGVDGLSVPLIVLTTFTSVLVIIGPWGPIQKRVSQYMAAMLVLEGMLIGIFCATANPVQVLVAETEQGRGVVGVVDGGSPLGVETDDDVVERRALLRAIGYKL